MSTIYYVYVLSGLCSSSRFWRGGQPDNWMGGDPDGEDCAMIIGGEWRDRSCGNPYEIICETKSCRAGV